MAYKTFVVERTEDESTQTAGPATLNRADVPPLVKVFDDELDIVLSSLSTNEIVATKNTDYSAVAVVDRVAKDNLNPVTSNAVSNAISYSTDETPTGGYWIDGKPIYRKVFEKAGPWSTSTEVNVGTISDFAQLVNSITITNSNSGGNQEVELQNYRTCRMMLSGTTATVRWQLNSGYNVNKVTIIVEYTKTTD